MILRHGYLNFTCGFLLIAWLDRNSMVSLLKQFKIEGLILLQENYYVRVKNKLLE